MTKDYVEIMSTKNITVTAGLQNVDLTKKDSDVPNRLKVNAYWPRQSCLIKQGKHVYPTTILKWESVKALSKQGVLTIGQYTEADESAKTIQSKLQSATTSYEKALEKSLKNVKDINLNAALQNSKEA